MRVFRNRKIQIPVDLGDYGNVGSSMPLLLLWVRRNQCHVCCTASPAAVSIDLVEILRRTTSKNAKKFRRRTTPVEASHYQKEIPKNMKSRKRLFSFWGLSFLSVEAHFFSMEAGLVCACDETIASTAACNPFTRLLSFSPDY